MFKHRKENLNAINYTKAHRKSYKNIEKQVMQTIKIVGTFDGIDNKLACDNLSIGNCLDRHRALFF